MMSTHPPVEFRASEEDYELIQQAAAEVELSISDYVRSRALDAARRDLAEPRTVRISSDHAVAFYAALDDDTPVPELQRLVLSESSWGRRGGPAARRTGVALTSRRHSNSGSDTGLALAGLLHIQAHCADLQ